MSMKPFNDLGIGVRDAQRKATEEREAFGSFECPICGHENVHGHEEETIARWIEAQAGRFNMPGWILVRGNNKPALSPCPYCAHAPRATEEGDSGIWYYTVRCVNQDCMIRPSAWKPTSEAAKTAWERLVADSAPKVGEQK